jgi:hypothetical protein
MTARMHSNRSSSRMLFVTRVSRLGIVHAGKLQAVLRDHQLLMRTFLSSQKRTSLSGRHICLSHSVTFLTCSVLALLGGVTIVAVRGRSPWIQSNVEKPLSLRLSGSRQQPLPSSLAAFRFAAPHPRQPLFLWSHGRSTRGAKPPTAATAGGHESSRLFECATQLGQLLMAPDVIQGC